MSFEKYLRQKQIEKEATEAASKSVNEIVGKMMRSEFQDVFKDAYDHWIDDACSHRYNASKSLALQVWQHQQSKIDELQKKNAWLSDVACRENKRANKLQEENVNTTTLLGKTIQEKNELQKRVDAAKYYMKNIFSGDAEVDQCHLGDLLDILDGKIVDELEQALKGDQ